MIAKIKSEYLTKALAVIFFAKVLYFGASLHQCIGALVVLLAIQSDIVVGYLFPKQPDLFKEVTDLKLVVSGLQSAHDELNHDVTALKLGSRLK